jgi:hypothetical protein
VQKAQGSMVLMKDGMRRMYSGKDVSRCHGSKEDKIDGTAYVPNVVQRIRRRAPFGVSWRRFNRSRMPPDSKD